MNKKDELLQSKNGRGVCISSRKADFKYNSPCSLTTVIAVILNFHHCNQHTIDNRYAKSINTFHPILLEELASDFKYIWLWRIDSKVIVVIRNLNYHLQTISNEHAKYEHPLSQHESGHCVTSRETDLSIFEGDFWLQCQKPPLSFTHHKQYWHPLSNEYGVEVASL